MPAAYDPNNIFAKIIRGEIPSYKIFETDDVLAILDAFPCAPGHSLLIPNKCEAVNVLSNLGAEAGQMVFHPHIHVIPRVGEDKLIKHPPAVNGMVDKDDALKM